MKEFLKSSIYKIIIVFLVIAADLITKEFLYANNCPIIPGLVGVRSVSGLNTGGAFSMLSGNLWLLILTTCVFIVLVCVYDLWAKDKNVLYGIALSLIVGGAIGNFIDRIFLGGVRDFLYFNFWQTFPTFNVADCFLFVGTVLMIIYAIFVYRPKDSKKEKVAETVEKTAEEPKNKNLHSTEKTKPVKEEKSGSKEEVQEEEKEKTSTKNKKLEKTQKDDKVKTSKNNSVKSKK